MNKLANENDALKKIIDQLSANGKIVCIEKSERFDFTDGTHSNMTEKRLKAVLQHLIEEYRENAAKEAGTTCRSISSKRMSAITTELAKAIMHRNTVKEAFETMPGWPQGLHSFDGKRYLIRSKIEPIQPVKGNWDDLKRFIDTLFGSEADDPFAEQQIHAFYCLLRAKYLQMRSKGENRGSCPLLVMVGGEGNGKTLLMRFIAQLLGQTDNTVDPSADRNGWTDQRLSSPVLFYDEASASEFGFSEGIPRGRFAEEFKRFEYSQAADITSRGKTAVKLPVVWLWARALNPDSQAAIMQTPIPTENGMSEKLILTKIHKGVLPLAGKEDEESRKIRIDLLESQVPAFGHWLLNDFKQLIRQEWIRRDDGSEYRNQAPPYFHPDILDILTHSDNDDSKIMTVRNFLLLDSLDTNKKFTAGQLHSQALQQSSEGMGSFREARAFIKLFDSAVKVGRILSKMAKDENSGVTCMNQGNNNFYSFEKPEELGA